MAEDPDALHSLTHLQRAYREFLRVAPDPLSPRSLAALMRTEPEVAYNYIARLKRLNIIQPIEHCNRRFPEYALVPGAEPPPEDSRGRKRNTYASRPISNHTDKVTRRIHRIR